jgi:hypothetical protein
MRAQSKAAIVILALVVSMVAELPANVANAQSAGSTTSTNEPYAQCVQEVPYDVKIGSYGNFQAAGYSATFPNGTKILYPDTSCVRPVYPNLYGVVLAIGDNPSFIALENGSLYSFSTIGSPNPFLLQNLTTETTSCRSGSTKVPGGQVECFAGEPLYFFLYNGTILNGCGSPYPDFSGSIQVQVPVNSTTGELDTTNIIAQQQGPFNGIFMCTTTTIITRTSSSTVTVSQNETSSSSTVTVSQNETSVATAPHRDGTINFEAVLLIALIFASCIIGVAVIAWRRRSDSERNPFPGTVIERATPPTSSPK